MNLHPGYWCGISPPGKFTRDHKIAQSNRRGSISGSEHISIIHEDDIGRYTMTLIKLFGRLWH